MRFLRRFASAALLVILGASWASSQTPLPPTNEAPPPAAQEVEDPDRRPNPVEPDFVIVGLPTTLRLPKFGSAFRVTHRFARPLNEGSFGDLLEDFFGIDGGAQIGLEYRFGVMRGLQAGIHRTSDRTIQFLGQYSALRQGSRFPLNLDALVTIEGDDNFREEYRPGVGAVVSYFIGNRAAVYAVPMFIGNTNPFAGELVADDNTFMIGVGGRVRVWNRVYVTGEVSPRASGYDPGKSQGSFGIETRVGGHVFQLNFSNGLGTTLGQIARGGSPVDDWFLGFNITRKFW